jgi:hypothetical protein
MHHQDGSRGCFMELVFHFSYFRFATPTTRGIGTGLECPSRDGSLRYFDVSLRASRTLV